MKMCKRYSTNNSPGCWWLWVRASMPRKDAPWWVLSKRETWTTLWKQLVKVWDGLWSLLLLFFELFMILFLSIFWPAVMPFLWCAQWAKTSYDNLLLWQSARVAHISGVKKSWVQNFNGMWRE